MQDSCFFQIVIYVEIISGTEQNTQHTLKRFCSTVSLALVRYECGQCFKTKNYNKKALSKTTPNFFLLLKSLLYYVNIFTLVLWYAVFSL